MRTPKVLFNVARIPPEVSSSLHSYLQCTRMFSPHSRANRMCWVPIYFFISPRWEVLFLYLHFPWVVKWLIVHVFTWLSFSFPFFFLVNYLFIPAFLGWFLHYVLFNVRVLCILLILLCGLYCKHFLPSSFSPDFWLVYKFFMYLLCSQIDKYFLILPLILSHR